MTSPRADCSLAPKLTVNARRAAELVFGRLIVTLALGAALMLALCAVCFGVGVFLAPWLLCELLALELGEATGQSVQHSRHWLSACLILFLAVLFMASVGWLTWLAFSTEPSAIEPSDAAELGRVLTPAGLLALASAIAALVFALPFLYAPMILLEGHVGLGAAVLESARLVRRGGMLPHVVLSLASHALQAAPLLFAALLASSLRESDSTGLWSLLSLPLLSLTIPLGQGMLVSAYAERRSDVAELRRTRLASRPTGGLVAVWVALACAPVVSFTLLGVSCVRPSRLNPGELPAGSETIAAFPRLRGSERVHPPGTALEIAISPHAADVVASDGGGVGRLPLRGRAPIEAARLARVRDTYAIELTQAGRRYVTFVDRAGVRLDDDLRARLLDRVPTWALCLMILSLLSTATALLPVLSALAELRRLYALEPGTRPTPRELSDERARTLSRARNLALLLVPLAAFSLYWGAQSVLG